MKKFQHLTIQHPDKVRLIDLLNRMKRTENKVFKLLKTETANYAKNIFMEVDNVACFKTERKTLFESKVWLYIGKEGLVVANITSESNNNLGVFNYNMVLNAFFSEVVRPLVAGYNCILSGEDISLSELLPDRVYNYLNLWQSTCNKSAPISHPNDNENWMNFLVAYYNQCDDVITSDDLQQWLIEDCHWPIGYDESVQKMGEYFDYSIELLSRYHENNN